MNKKDRLLKIFLSSGLIKALSILLGFAIQSYLARNMSLTEYGNFSFIYSIASLATIVFTFGFYQLLLRDGPRYFRSGSFEKIDQIFTVSIVVVFLSYPVILLLLFYFFDNVIAYIVSAFIFINSINMIYISLLKSKNKIVSAEFVNLNLQQLLILIPIVIFVGMVENLSVELVLIVYFIASLSSWFFYVYIDKKAGASKIKTKGLLIFFNKGKATSLKFMFSNLAQMLNIQLPILFFGIYGLLAENALYIAALKIATIVSFTLSLSNMFIARQVSILFYENKMERLQNLLTKFSILNLVFSSLMLMLIFLFGGGVLSYIFGSDYVEALAILKILSIAHFVNSFFGPVGIVLNMMKYEEDVLKVTIAIILVTSIFYIYLIETSSFFTVGIVSGMSIIFWNLILFMVIKNKTGISTTIFWRKVF